MLNVECQMYIYTVRNWGRETLNAQCRMLNVKCIYILLGIGVEKLWMLNVECLITNV